MLGKFFNSFYYGKAGKGDLTPEQLPKNRIELFGEVLRVRLSALFRLNLLYVLFFIPAILWTLLNYALMDNILAAQIAGEILESEAAEQMLGLVGTWLLILWPCIAITGPATAGISYITRNWARDQHSFMLSDFKDAFRGNWKQALCVSTLSGLAPLLMFVSYRFYGQLASTSSAFFIVPQMLVLIVAVLWFLSQQLIYTLMVTYRLNLVNLIRNSFVLAVGKLPLSVGIRLLSLIPAAIGLLLLFIAPQITGYVLLVLLLYYVLFGFAFNKLLYAAYANAICEKYINPQIEGAGVGMGLRQVTDDDYEIDPTMPQPKREEDEDQP